MWRRATGSFRPRCARWVTAGGSPPPLPCCPPVLRQGIVRKVVFSHLFNLLTGKGRKGKKKGAEQQEEAAAVAGGADAPAGAAAAH